MWIKEIIFRVQWPEGFVWPVKNLNYFTTQSYVIMRRESSEWLEWSIESDLDMLFAICSPNLAIHDFFGQKFFWTGYLKEYLTCRFLGFWRTKFLYPWSMILNFRLHTMPQTTPFPPVCATFLDEFEPTRDLSMGEK